MKIKIILLLLISININAQSFEKKKKSLNDSIKIVVFKNKLIKHKLVIDSLENYSLNKNFLFNKSKVNYQKELLKKPIKNYDILYKKYDSLKKQKEILNVIYNENLLYDKEVSNNNLIKLKEYNQELNLLKDSLRFANKRPAEQLKKELYTVSKNQIKFNLLVDNQIAINKEYLDIYKDSMYQIFKKKHKIRKFKLINNKPLDLPILYQNPLKNKLYITSDYGYRTHPIKKTKSFHSGVDLRGKYINVYAVMEGVVTKVGYDKALGIFIEITHKNGYKSIYGHLSEFFVLEETKIEINKPIGKTGNTGSSTASHLHFAVKKNNQFINPNFLLKKKLN